MENIDEADTSAARSTLQPDWANAPTYKDLKGDRDQSEEAHSAYREKLLEWKETREGGKKITAPVGKSTARPKLVRKQNEWKYPALEEPFLNTADMFEIRPRTFEDVAAAEQNSLILNTQWSTKINKTKLIGDIVRNIVDEGTVIVKTGWESQEGVKTVEEEQPVYASAEESLAILQQAVQTGEMSNEEAQAMIEMGQPVQIGVEKVYVERETLIKNQPTYEVCHNDSIIVDPTCEGLIENAMFVIHEFDTSFADLKDDEYTVDEEGRSSGIYHNLDQIEEDDEDSSDDEFESDSKRSFKYSDKARKVLRASEYWGYWDIQGDDVLVAIVATWVGKVLVRLEENPFPHGRLPFSIATYMPVKKEVYGEPDAEILKENQDSVGKMQRAIYDITAKTAVAQEFIDENFFPSPSQRSNYEKGHTVYYRSGFDPKRAIYKSVVDQVPSSVFDVINYNISDAENLTGTRAFGQTSASTATGVRSASDAASKREQSILRRLGDLLFKDMARMTIAMNQEFLSEEEVVRVTNGEFVTVRRDDLAGEFDLRIEVSTPEKDNDTAEKLMTLMQTNGANMDPAIANMHYVKIAKLWKQPDLAEEVKNFKPQPDPKQQQLMDLEIQIKQLEIEKLKKDIEEADSRIIERLSRAEENDIDQRKKLADATHKEAQTRNIDSKTDEIDQNIIDKFSGKTRIESIEDQEFKATVDMMTKSKLKGSSND